MGKGCATAAKFAARYKSSTYTPPAYCSGTWGYYVVALMSILVAISMVPMVVGAWFAHDLIVYVSFAEPWGTSVPPAPVAQSAPVTQKCGGALPSAAVNLWRRWEGEESSAN